jgi:hypothetical protein
MNLKLVNFGLPTPDQFSAAVDNPCGASDQVSAIQN